MSRNQSLKQKVLTGALCLEDDCGLQNWVYMMCMKDRVHLTVVLRETLFECR